MVGNLRFQDAGFFDMDILMTFIYIYMTLYSILFLLYSIILYYIILYYVILYFIIHDCK